MSPPNLRFKRIEIRRMPGFPRGGIDVEELSPGVNVIYGPNGSGKTTLSRAIQKLLRPGDPPHEERSLFASLEVDGRACTIDYDLGRVRFQQDGADADCPNLAPADIGDRYVLALHDLIRSEDGADLATEIVRQSAGGYDVGEARRTLGFRDGPSRTRSPTKNLEAAIRRRQDARRKQEELVAQETTLADLNRQRSEIRDAASQLQRVEFAIAYQEAKARRDKAQQKVDAFPAGVSKLRGDEIDRLVALRKSRAEAEGDCAKAKSKVDSASRTLDESRLTDEGVAPELVGELRLKCGRLQKLFSETHACEQKLEKAGEAAAQARRNLGSAVTAEPSDPLDLDAVEALSRFARRAEQLRADAAADESLRAWLGADAALEPENAHSPDVLAEASGWLGRWLAVDDVLPAARPGSRVVWGVTGAAAMGLVSAAMALFVHPSWLLLMPAAVAVLAWALVPPRTSDARAQYRREFESLGVGSPASWTADDVRSLQRQLQDRLAAAKLRHERGIKWADLAGQREEFGRRQRELHEEKASWHRRLGITLDEAETDEAWLYLLAANLNRLHQDEQVRAGAAAALDVAGRQYETLLGEVNREIGRFGFSAAEDPEAASGRVEQLDREAQSHRTATQALRDARGALERLDGEIASWQREEAELFDRLGLTPDQEVTLRQWAEMHPDYRDAVEALRLAEHDRANAEAALADQRELQSVSLETLVDERDRCEALAGQLEEVNRRIGEIDNAIAAAKQATDLEAALAQEAACRDVLRELREQDCGALLGGVLADFVAGQQRERQRPAVLRRAQKLFVQITHGRYRLDVDPGDPPGFRALDTDREVGLGLDELSSGTRLQLLLAVRVAFVEQQEQGVKLPLILDETLGNSDERRAQQIIDAAIEICHDGRQVFYFTAQHDEARKWEAMLHQHDDVPRKLIDLAELRQFSEAERVPRVDYEPPKPPSVPSPEGLDWLGYGRRLQVPPSDPNRELGGIHLWYLIDELPTLYRLLRHGVNRWGQLQALAACGHDDSLSKVSETFRRAQASARLLDAVFRHWRIGRGAPVDRQILVHSGAVSEKYLDRVSDLASKTSGDAKAIIAALESGQVRGFRADKRKALREYLVNQGYLDEHDVLTADQIRERVRPAVFADMEKGLISAERFEQLLSMVLNVGLSGVAADGQ